ncbi:MAG: hypothetical protein KIT48_04580 [Pseudolabrys sp.]|nr:hypothetical protein [Pseudolabrys sp.]
MSNKKLDSDQTASEIFAARRAEARKRIFGAPINWAKVFARPIREIAGLSFGYASELVSRQPKPHDPADVSPLALAIRIRWPNSEPTYWAMVARRFRELYKDLPEQDAVKAVRAGYSSPANAMKAGVIKRRRYLGFPEDDVS